MSAKVLFEDLGLIDYQKAWDYQESVLGGLVSAKLDKSGSKKEVPGRLLFCEHPHVYTIGKSGSEKNLLIHNEQLKAKGAIFFKINRGGDITYHGPGQIVGYPIFDLEPLGIGVKKYIFLLEDAIIQTLHEYGLKGERADGATGVWLDAKDQSQMRKICAIGVRVSRFVTMHGFAFNVKTDLEYFRYINPCGFVDKGVTSMDQELKTDINISEVKSILKQKIVKVFRVALEG